MKTDNFILRRVMLFICAVMLIFVTAYGYQLRLNAANEELNTYKNGFDLLEQELSDTQAALKDAKSKLKIESDKNTDLSKSLNNVNADLKTANATIEELKKDEYELVYLGDYRLTAYCPCEICCGQWALNRPKDSNGNPIVHTATGTVAQQGRTIGVNPSVIPYGTQVYISGLGWRTAEDTGSGIGKKHIDVYMNSHQAALSSGLSHGDVWMLVKK